MTKYNGKVNYSSRSDKVNQSNPNDKVNHPRHYTQLKFEVIDIIDEIVPHYSPYIGGHIQNVIKYIFRAPFKGDSLEDLKKAQFYLNHGIEKLEGSFEKDRGGTVINKQEVEYIDKVPEMNPSRILTDDPLYRYTPETIEYDE